MSGVVNEEGDEVMVTTAADLVARAFETFFLGAVLLLLMS